MNREPHSARARRYFLGTTTEEDAATLEQEYFNNPDALERLAAAEDDLIEDYLGNRLTPEERDQFEREYLAAPHRRRRVETIRQLMAAAGRLTSGKVVASPATRIARLRWLAAAAALILVVAAGMWFARSGTRPGTVAENQSPASSPNASMPNRKIPEVAPSPPLQSPQLFAVSISPTTVRAASGAPSIVIPPGTEVIALSLEGDTVEKVAAGRASVRTVTGDEVWAGSTTFEGALPQGVVARLMVPAARLPVNDYLITIFETNAGAEKEVYRYFLRIRAR